MDQAERVGGKEGKMLILEAGHLLLVQQKGIVYMHDHDTQKINHEWLCLRMEVPKHLVAVPVANQLDDVTVSS